MSRLLIYIGICLIVIGFAWPWLIKIPFGKLPGDIFIERENFRFFFPITTSIIISIILTIIFWILKK